MAVILSEERGERESEKGGVGGGLRELERLMAGVVVFDAAILGSASRLPLIGFSEHIYLFR